MRLYLLLFALRHPASGLSILRGALRRRLGIAKTYYLPVDISIGQFVKLEDLKPGDTVICRPGVYKDLIDANLR